MAVIQAVGSDRIKVTKDSANLIRRKAAQNGFAVGDIKTHEDHIDAIVKGLPDQVVDKLMAMLEEPEGGNIPPTA